MAMEVDTVFERTVRMIAWLSHHLPTDIETTNGIPGKYRGGAEMTDARYLEAAPEQVKVFGPDQWKEAMDADKLIITGTDLLTDEAMTQLATKNPVIMVHHKQTRTPARQLLIDSAQVLICHTPKHLEIELSWTNPKSSTWIISSHNPDDFTSKPKEDFALWAGRLHHQKGPDNALRWAEHNGIPLVLYWNKPREQVLETMSRAKHFVFLPNDFDAEPRTVIEAVLSGCQVHLNDQVGISSIPQWDNPEIMAELVSNAGRKFWETAL
jgi:hypothetical protein